MAIVGGALMPKLQATIIDIGGYAVNDIRFLGVSEINLSFILPALCFIYIARYGLKNQNWPFVYHKSFKNYRTEFYTY